MDARDCKRFALYAGFCSVQVPLNPSCNVHVNIILITVRKITKCVIYFVAFYCKNTDVNKFNTFLCGEQY